MYSAKIENANGQVYIMTGKEAVYQITNIIGLNPPVAQINVTTVGGMDGAMFNSSKLETRNIVLTVKINGDVETNRQNLYRYFRTKDWCRFYYKNQNRDVYIDGYVESVECDLFTNNETAQISILCPSPYFKSVAEIITDISNTLAMFTFPFSINIGYPIAFSAYENSKTTNVYNSSESETGLIIEIDIEASVDEIKIININTGQYIYLEYEFLEHDRVTIDTNKGNKTIQLYRNGEKINIFSALQKGSVFFQLDVGDNLFGYLVDDGNGNENVYIVFRRHETYRGV